MPRKIRNPGARVTPMAAGDVGSETALEVRAGADGLLHVNGMTFLRLLGRGSFGEVVLAREDAGGDLVVRRFARGDPLSHAGQSHGGSGRRGRPSSASRGCDW